MPSYLYLRKDGDFSISKLIMSETEALQGTRNPFDKFIKHTPSLWVRNAPLAWFTQNCYPSLGRPKFPSLFYSKVCDDKGAYLKEFRYFRKRIKVLRENKR